MNSYEFIYLLHEITYHNGNEVTTSMKKKKHTTEITKKNM